MDRIGHYGVILYIAAAVGVIVVCAMMCWTDPAIPRPAPPRDDVGDDVWRVLAEARRITVDAAAERER